MKPALQRRVQRYGWDRAADRYEASWRAQLAPAQREMLRMAELETGERVLDVACGTGLASLPAASAVGPAGEVVGTDISSVMLEIATARAASSGLENLSFRRMGAEELDLPEGSFDAALCALGLMYVPDPGRALAEIRRVLRPRGRLAAAVWGARGNCGWAGIFPVVDERVNTEVCPLFFQLGTGDTLARAAAAAGFEEVELVRLSTRLRYETAEAALEAAFAGGPVAMAYSRFDDALREDAHRAYLQTIEPYCDGEGYDLPGEFVVVRARRPATGSRA